MQPWAGWWLKRPLLPGPASSRPGFADSAERAASRIAGALLLLLAAYVVIAAGWKLWSPTGETFSWPGFLVTLLAMPGCMGSLAGTRSLRLVVTGGRGWPHRPRFDWRVVGRFP